MKTYLILTILLLAASLSAEEMKWSFNRTNNTFNIKIDAQPGDSVSLVRYDIKHKYTDVVTNFWFRQGATNVIWIFNPLTPSEDQPAPSDQCWFYIVRQNFR